MKELKPYMKKLIYALLLILIIPACKSEDSTVNVYFFQNNACVTCNERAVLEEILSAAEKPTRGYAILEYKAFTTEDKDEVDSLKEFIGEDSLNFPIVVVGSTVLSGYNEINDGFAGAVNSYNQSAVDNFSPIPKTLVNMVVNYPKIDENKNYGVLFTTESCRECSKVKDYLKNTAEITIEERSIADNSNTKILQDFFEKYNVPTDEQAVPILFLADTYFSGLEEIKTDLEKAISQGKALNFAYPQTKEQEVGLSPLATIGTGLVNGLNPCALSMLFLLLSILVNMREKVVSRGLAYLLGKFTAYIGLGILLATIANSLNLSWLSGVRFTGGIILLIFSLVFAVGNFIDFYNAKKENYGKIRMQLPSALRKLNNSAIGKIGSGKYTKVLIPALFLLGLIISAGELLCTGQIYLASILYASQSGGGIPIFHLIIYVSAMCVPSILAVILVGTGKRVLEVSEFSRKNMPLIKLLNGILFLVFAVLAIFMFF